jgi:hypothetical protein
MIDKEALLRIVQPESEKPAEPAEPTPAETVADPRRAEIASLKADLEAHRAIAKATNAKLLAGLAEMVKPK